MPQNLICPNCLKGELKVFHHVHRVPVHSVLLMPTRDVAVNYPKGDIALGFCSECGFISNTAFDPGVHEYSTAYEETQGFSATFREFHTRLANNLIDAYDLHGKTVVEIGCGKGEFLRLLCELGGNRGVGIDPAFREDRNPVKDGVQIEFIQDFYSEKYSHIEGDFFCCKMTLEHISDTANFIRTVRSAVGERKDAVIFFQVPDASRVLKDIAFWDIYYEHCSYFSAGSLARVFREAGFSIERTWTDYDDQYLMIAAKPSETIEPISQLELDTPAIVWKEVENFLAQQRKLVNYWQDELKGLNHNGKKAVVWGSGSKGVAFLTSLGLGNEIEYVVDINPYRQGKYMAGTGQEIVAPEFLSTYKPDVAIAMNPVYKQEIQADLVKLGLETAVMAV